MWRIVRSDLTLDVCLTEYCGLRPHPVLSWCPSEAACQPCNMPTRAGKTTGCRRWLGGGDEAACTPDSCRSPRTRGFPFRRIGPVRGKRFNARPRVPNHRTQVKSKSFSAHDNSTNSNPLDQCKIAVTNSALRTTCFRSQPAGSRLTPASAAAFSKLLTIMRRMKWRGCWLRYERPETVNMCSSVLRISELRIVAV